jgi:ubiquinone/menaquinone biosynthesis C-methylase UbiE
LDKNQLTERIFYPYPGAQDPEGYEWLNLCTDPDQRIESFINQLCQMNGKIVVDLGAGSGFHALRYSSVAKHVYAIEPDQILCKLMSKRFEANNCKNASYLHSGAEEIPLLNDSVDLVIARFAYFFGTPACIPGLLEVNRILKYSGFFFIIDADPDGGGYPGIARQVYPNVFHLHYSKDNVAFYHSFGFHHQTIDTEIRAPDRSVLEKIFRLDFPHDWSDLVVQVSETELPYRMNVFWRSKVIE